MKDYLGDSVYAATTEFGELQLTTDNGFGASNTIILDHAVVRALLGYLQRTGWAIEEGRRKE